MIIFNLPNRSFSFSTPDDHDSSSESTATSINPQITSACPTQDICCATPSPQLSVWSEPQSPAPISPVGSVEWLEETQNKTPSTSSDCSEREMASASSDSPTSPTYENF